MEIKYKLLHILWGRQAIVVSSCQFWKHCRITNFYCLFSWLNNKLCEHCWWRSPSTMLKVLMDRTPFNTIKWLFAMLELSTSLSSSLASTITVNCKLVQRQCNNTGLSSTHTPIKAHLYASPVLHLNVYQILHNTFLKLKMK